MTIWFHEGLPRSGKSYEAMVKHALVALKAGRKVVTNIKGVNAEKIAEVLDIPVQEIEALIIIIPWEDTPNCWKYIVNDCLLLLDEVQDFWPATRDRLGKEITELITQHGQRGMDIILMGQANKDCHALWRRRIDKLIYFVQKDAIGQPTKYAWHLSKQVGDGKFQKINSGSGEYEEKYFGIYKSHVDGTNNKEAYSDDRANILKRPLFRYGFPAFGIVIICAMYFLYHVFTTPGAMVGQAVAGEITAPQGGVYASGAVNASPQLQQPALGSASPVSMGLEEYTPPKDYVEKLFDDYRPRLAGFVHNETMMMGQIEFFKADDAHRREVLSFQALRSFGYEIERTEYGVKITKGPLKFDVTAWPFDSYGSVPQRVQSSGLITGTGLQEM